MESAQLLDFGDYPRIDAAGVGDFYVLPDGRVRFLMFDWVRVSGTWRRQVVGQVTRPVTSMRAEHMRFWKETFSASRPPDAQWLLQ